MKLKDVPDDAQAILTSVYTFCATKPMDVERSKEGYKLAVETNADLLLNYNREPHLFNVEIKRDGRVVDKLNGPVGSRGGSAVHRLLMRNCRP